MVYLLAMKRAFIFSFAAATIVLSSLAAFADYTILLRNGRKFIVQNFREEAGMIKFNAFGGEISILKNQIQTISPAGEVKASTEAPLRSAPATVAENSVPALEKRNIGPQVIQDKSASVEKESIKPTVKQEDVYRQQIKKIDDQLKELRGRYATETRGNTGVDPFLFTTEEAFRGHQEDLLSRLRDAQHKAQGLPSGSEAQSPPLSTNPPPAYTEKQKLLSDLRNQLNELESERERVIAEMKRDDVDTGSLSSE
jgi:hypothetical protein